jgi:SAM-dependent methyltransferase
MNAILEKLVNKLRRIKIFLNQEFFKLGKVNYRNYTDNSNDNLIIDLKEGNKTSYAFSVIFSINYNDKSYKKEILYSYLTLLKLLKDHIKDFNSLLDIGSAAGNCSDIFKFLGKDVTRVEHLEIYDAEYRTDFITTDFNKKFDCIWASQVLEHQRNIGLFLNKCFDDLNENGILAITVPYQTNNNSLELGHSVIFNPLNLIYNLVLAGFDCSEIKLKVYDFNIGIILKKKYNGINRQLSMASTLPFDLSKDKELYVKMNDKNYYLPDLAKKETFVNFYKSMPSVIKLEHVTYFGSENINWKEFA